MITHLLKKDIRHCRVLLAVWALFIAFQFALIGYGANPADRVMLSLFQVISTLVPLFQMLLLVVIIPHVVHDEPLVGTTAFWFTRPIAPPVLLKAKSLFLLLFVVALPLFAELTVLAVNGVTAHDIALATAEIIMNQLAMIMFIALLAVLTPNFARFAIAGAVLFVGWLIVLLAVQFMTIFLHPEKLMANALNFSLQQSRGVAASVLTILAGACIVSHQYLTRKTARTIVATAIAAAAVIAIQSSWPFDFLKPPPVKSGNPGFDVAAVKVELGSGPSVSDAPQIRGRGTPDKSLQAVLDTPGVPRGYLVEAECIQSHLALPNGRTLPLQSSGRAYGGERWEADSLELALGGISVVNAPDNRSQQMSRQLFTLSADTYNKYFEQPLTYSAEIQLLVSKYAIAGVLPLQKGARYDQGSDHLVITDVLHQPDGLMVLLRERKVNLIFDRKKTNQLPAQNPKNMVYLLRNQKRHEAIVQKQSGFDFSIGLQSQSRLLNELVRLSFGSDRGSNQLIPDLTPEWLADADLVRLELKPVADFTKQLVVEKFKLNGKGDISYRRSSVLAGPDKQELAKITLPENPTKQQVKDYIRSILLVSQRQNSFSNRDPQIDMFAKVGAQNIDLLIASLNSHNSNGYLIKAIGQLARPDDKDLILQALPVNHDLIGVVVKNNWTADARETLVSALGDEKQFLPFEWIKAVASFEDPSTYPALKSYFLRHTGDIRETFDAIKNLPGLDLTDAVDSVWKRAKFKDGIESIRASLIAADYGHADAVDFAANVLRKSANNYERKCASELLRKFTPASGDDRALLAWYDANHAKLAFDPAIKKFVPSP